MLIMAASTFYKAGLNHIATLEEAHITLEPLLGGAASWLFAVSLLFSGLSSSAVGTMAGHIIMKGFLNWQIPLVIRRIATMAPAVIIIMLGLDPTRSLVISQVVLCFGIPFALIPLIMFTANKSLMGSLVNKWWVTALAIGIALLVICLNAVLIQQTIWGR